MTNPNTYFQSALQKIKDYLFGRMSQPQQHSYERDLLKDAFESDAIDGLSMLSEDEFEKDLAFLQQQLPGTKKKNHKVIFALAATLLAITGAISILTLLTNDDEVMLSDSGTKTKKEITSTAELEDSIYESAKKTERVSPEENNTEEALILQEPLMPPPGEPKAEVERKASATPLEKPVSSKKKGRIKVKLPRVQVAPAPVEQEDGFEKTPFLIKGEVQDRETGQALQGVTVIKEGTNQTEFTGAAGIFTTEAEYDDILTFSLKGYKSEHFRIKDSHENLIVHLEPIEEETITNTSLAMLKEVTEEEMSAESEADEDQSYSHRIPSTLYEAMAHQLSDTGLVKRAEPPLPKKEYIEYIQKKIKEKIPTINYESFVLILHIDTAGIVSDVEFKDDVKPYEKNIIDSIFKGEEKWEPAKSRNEDAAEDKVRLKLKLN